MATQDATDAGANFFLDALGSATTDIFVGLSSTLPTRTSFGNPPTGEYVRAPVRFSAASARKRTNTTVANFVSGGGVATTSQGNFGWATFHSLVTGGTYYAFTPLSQTLVWQTGLPVTMAVGDVSLEFEIT